VGSSAAYWTDTEMPPPITDASLENQLLASASAETLKRLKPSLTLVPLVSGKILYGVDEKVDFVFFPRAGAMVSLLAVTEEGDTAEVGVTGFEGAVGIQAVLGGFNNTFDYLVQLAGDGWKLKAEALRQEFRRDQSFQNAVMQYMQASFAQISQTALCNRLHNVEERISRWLLLCQDRANGGQITLTHEMLGKMLGTRRSTVSLAAATLQQAGMIEYNRGRISIVDRKALERASCTCYSIVKKQFDGLYS
jgi:cAMP-binding proteins - catabolite gene activator and regulatory subunit of cAMP-dependent protein kinases